MNNVGRAVLVAAGVAVVGFVAIGEISHGLARNLAMGRRPVERGGSEAIIVLGYPSRPDGSPHPLQRWRARIALRSADPAAASTTYICTGAGKADGPSEARVLAGLLRDLGVPADRIVLEEQARTTWENLEYCAPLLSDVDVIKIASNSLHAWRGRRFLRRQSPRLADRLVPANDYRFGEYLWMKCPLAIYEAVGAWREWRNPRLPDAKPRP